MATVAPPDKPLLHVQQYSIGAGILSYLIPGLGQIVQGRVGKGILFLVCIYTLFFYGVYLGTGSVTLNGTNYRISSNVYLPDAATELPNQQRQWPALFNNLYTRPQFAGQFWVGIAAWPAIYQYLTRVDPTQQRMNEQIPFPEGEDGQPAANRPPDKPKQNAIKRAIGDFMSEPDPVAVNAVSNARDKRLELAWVYTVIAGVLNILVIYDAIAGPAFGLAAPSSDKKG